MFRFSIRDVFFATMVAGLFFGWVCDRSQLEAKHELRVAELQKENEAARLRELVLKKRLDESSELIRRFNRR